MPSLILSILIATVPSRRHFFYPRILDQLLSQISVISDYEDHVEILGFFDNKKRTTGEKRQDLLQLAKGEYIVFIDDDDRISDDYIQSIMDALVKDAPDTDVVVFDSITRVNGGKKCLCKYGIEYEYGMINAESTQWRGKPAHTMVWKALIAKKHDFSVMQNGEDVDWVKRAHLDIRKQHRIDKILYYYDANYQTTSETANLPKNTIEKHAAKFETENRDEKEEKQEREKQEYFSDHWQKCHTNDIANSQFFLSGYNLENYLSLFRAHEKYRNSRHILEIGIGEGTALKDMLKTPNKILYAVDIVPEALEKIKPFVKNTYLLDELHRVSKNTLDIIFCHLVVQHITDRMLRHHITHLIPCLKEDGIYYIQYRGKVSESFEDIPMTDYIYGDIERSESEMRAMISDCGGKVMEDIKVMESEFIGNRFHPWNWRIVKIQRKTSNI